MLDKLMRQPSPGRSSLDIFHLKSETYDCLCRFIGSELKLEEALNLILDSLLSHFNTKAGSIMLADPSRQVLNFNVVRGEQSANLKNLTVRRGEGIAGKVFDTGEPVLINDTDRSLDFNVNMASDIKYIPRRIICVPLRVKKSIYGVIELMDPADNTNFSMSDLDLLQSVAEPVAIMIENISLFQSKEDDIDSLRTLMQLNRIINTTLDLQSLLEQIMAAAKALLRSEASSLLLIDEKTQELYFNVVETTPGKESILKEIRLPIGIGVAGIVAKTGEILIVNDAPNDRRVFRKADEMTSFKTRNILAVPIKVRDRIIGVLEVINSVRKTDYDQNDLSLLQSMAEQAGIAIHNRALIDSLQTANVSLEQRIRELTVINKISQFISKNFDYNITEILSKTVRIVSEILDVRRVSIFLHDEARSTLRMVHATGIPTEQLEGIESPLTGKVMGHVFRTGQSLLIEDLNQHPELGRFKRLRYATRSFVCIPLIVKNKIVGVMNLADRKDGRSFQKSDQQIIETISNQVSESYENSLFYKEVLEKQRMEKELEVANAIQQHILSKEFLNFEGVDVVATSIPASEIGGDFYDCLRIADGQYGVYIADVSGKGVPAALFMALSHSIMKIVALNERAPAATLSQANRFILSDSKNGMFVTLFYCFIDINQKFVHYGCAGHNEQFYYDSRAGKLELIKTKGIPLGVAEGATYPQGTLSVTKGDFLVLFTDGVIEALNKDNEQYGIQRLQSVLSRCTDRSALEILGAVQEDVKQFCGAVKQFDDLTLFVIKFK